MKKKNLLLSCSLIAVLGGCLSEEEIASRRDHAFDLTGSYEAILLDSGIGLDLHIVNEEGNHDILISMNRRGSFLSDEELAFLSKLERKHQVSLSEERFLRNSSSIEIGKGRSFMDFDGGENISNDFGKSSRFNICSEDVQTKKIKAQITTPSGEIERPRLHIFYCLSGIIQNDTKDVIDGRLTLESSISYDFGEEGFGVSFDEKITLPYTAKRKSQR
ncbi:MAG: hypothetical protein OXB88_02810 [Bacteriovoracales bacterium]|nr:hypothetical protein [Bacteriovoracales bacterium]